MRDPLVEGKFFKDIAKATSAQSVQGFLCDEHRLIVAYVKIPSDPAEWQRVEVRMQIEYALRRQPFTGMKFLIFRYFSVRSPPFRCQTEL